MNPIPPMTEEDRNLRMEFERQWLKNSLAGMRSDDLDPAELSKLMQHYCQLKKEDNAQDKNLVSFTIAESRLALAEARLAARRSRLRGTHESSFGAFDDDAWDQPSTSSTQSTPSTQLAPAPSNSPFAIDNSESDHDVDPEWSLAPWGRRKNGKPRTEKEYRTILYRAVRDVYGLDLDRPSEEPSPLPESPLVPESSLLRESPLVRDSHLAPTSAGIPSREPSPPISNLHSQVSDQPRSQSLGPDPPDDDSRNAHQQWPEPEPRREEPFVPRITNPWYYF